jgi:hypothetical protein
MSTHLFKYYCKNCAWSEKLVSNVDLFQRRYENAKPLGQSSPEYLAALRAYDRARMSYANHQLNLEEEAEQSQAIQGKGVASCGQRRRRCSSFSPTPQAGSNKRARVDEESYRIVSRVRFDEVQEHRAEADYRVNLEYERSIQWYVPGKYAASPGNELLDTGGNSLTPQEFYGDKLPVQERIAE